MNTMSAPVSRYRLAPENRLVQAVNGVRVRTGIDDDVLPEAPAHVHHGTHLAGHLFSANDLLPLHVAAALRENLVLDIYAGDAQFD